MKTTKNNLAPLRRIQVRSNLAFQSLGVSRSVVRGEYEYEVYGVTWTGEKVFIPKCDWKIVEVIE